MKMHNYIGCGVGLRIHEGLRVRVVQLQKYKKKKSLHHIMTDVVKIYQW